MLPANGKKRDGCDIRVKDSEETISTRLPSAEAFVELHDPNGRVEAILESEAVQKILHKAFEQYKDKMQAAVNGMPPMNIPIAQAMFERIFADPECEIKYIDDLKANIIINVQLYCKNERSTPKGKNKSVGKHLDRLLEGAPEKGLLVDMINRLLEGMNKRLIKCFQRNVLQIVLGGKLP